MTRQLESKGASGQGLRWLESWGHPAAKMAMCMALLGSLVLIGCGGSGGSSSPPPAAPAVSVSLSQDAATVQAGASANFTASVSNDSANRGVTWSVSCPTAPCGTFSPTSTASGAPTTYSASTTAPASNVMVAVVATSVTDPTKTASAGVTVPAISVSVSPGTATVQAASAIRLAATVAYDPSNNGTIWAVSCSAPPCGTIAPTSTPSGTATTYTAPPTLPSGGVNITVKATSLTDTSKSSSATLIPVGHVAGYDVGADYHAYGADFNSTAFITTYNQQQVRQTVLAQLQGMADRGATIISTRIWFVTEPGTTNFGETWRATFPMSDQEESNLHVYAQDVSKIVGSGGNRLRLDVGMLWLGAADYTRGNLTSGLGFTPLTPNVFTSRVEQTTDKVLNAVTNVLRPDGVPIVETIYMEGEVMIGAKANQDWFLTTHYPRFVSRVSAAGFKPAVYFDAAASLNDQPLVPGYIDPTYPILNGHRTMYWIYRSLKFMSDNGLPLPPRIDFSCYTDPAAGPMPDILARVLDDADATLPSLGAPKSYGAAETYYFLDDGLRRTLGQAFAGQAALSSRMQRVTFWTSPDGGGPGINAAYPFTIEDFLPPPP